MREITLSEQWSVRLNLEIVGSNPHGSRSSKTEILMQTYHRVLNKSQKKKIENS